MKRLGEEKIFMIQGLISLLLLLITIVVCSFSHLIPEEEGIISAALCISIVLFFVIMSVLSREGIEGLLYALIGSFIAYIALTLLGSRLAFDPSISSYLLASITLSAILSLSGTLYVMPKSLGSKKIYMKRVAMWIFSIMFAIAVNFMIIYWVPKMV
ncbi:MAG: hypothetical protein QXE14_03005 [Candidatus Bathyarchaeia archaeon]